jgi:hypothetical protein
VTATIGAATGLGSIGAMFHRMATALLTLPHLKSSNDALVAVISHSYPAWFIGLAAGAVTGIAMVGIPAVTDW